MYVRLYTVYDKVAEEAGPIFQAKTDGVAMRNYQGLVQSQNLNPDDYLLYYLGTFNTEDMIIDYFKQEVTLNMVADSEVRK
jgi:hypothetical protein